MTVSQTGVTSISTVSVTSGDAVNAYSIAVQIPSSSTAIPNTGSPTLPIVTKTFLTTTGATSSSGTQSSSNATLVTGTNSTQYSGLSTGGKAGVCVGIFFGVAIVSLGLCWGKKRRRTQGHLHLSTAPDRVGLPINSVHEMPINPVPELSTDYVTELPTDYVPAIMNRLPEMSHHGSQINVVEEHSKVP